MFIHPLSPLPAAPLAPPPLPAPTSSPGEQVASTACQMDCLAPLDTTISSGEYSSPLSSDGCGRAGGSGGRVGGSVGRSDTREQAWRFGEGGLGVEVTWVGAPCPGNGTGTTPPWPTRVARPLELDGPQVPLPQPHCCVRSSASRALQCLPLLPCVHEPEWATLAPLPLPLPCCTCGQRSRVHHSPASGLPLTRTSHARVPTSPPSPGPPQRRPGVHRPLSRPCHAPPRVQMSVAALPLLPHALPFS